MLLSKSDYLKYRTCPSYFWLWKNKSDEVPDESSEAVRDNKFEQGNKVEALARNLFPSAILIEGYNVTAEASTKKAVKDGAQTLFQATVIVDGLLAMADVLEREGDGWRLYEVKATGSIKKDSHIPDMAFQKIAFEKAGYTIVGTSVIHLNKEYVRSGDSIDPKTYFEITDISSDVEAITPEVRDEIDIALEVMEQPDEPTSCPCRELSRGKHCPTFKRFNPDVPDYSVYDIARMQGKKLLDLIDNDVLKITDIPNDFSLTPNQKVQVDVEKGALPRIDAEMVRRELATLEYPLYFIDYESVNPAIPILDGTKPHQQVVFQYSLHILDTPDAELRHAEYLCRDASQDTFEKLALQMSRDVDDTGSVIVWNKSFERSRNKEMAELFPELKPFFESMNNRMYDLMDVFSKNYYVHPGFRGSNSIKDVLPILAPHLSYKELAIGKGDLAAVRWFEIVTGENTSDKEETFSHLLTYCKLDTFAMVEIYNVLNEV